MDDRSVVEGDGSGGEGGWRSDRLKEWDLKGGMLAGGSGGCRWFRAFAVAR